MKNNLSLEEFSKLLGYLYGGHIEEDPYGNFLELLREIIDCNFASMTLREPIGDDGGLLFVSSDALQKTFIDDHSNPFTDQYYKSNILTGLPWGEVQTLDQSMPYAEMEDSDLFRLCMQPINIYHMMGIDLRNQNGQRFCVRLCRPKDMPNFNAEDKQLFQELGSHIQRAVASGMQLIHLDSERNMLAKAISGRSIGTLTLDRKGKVVSCNLAANEMARTKDGFALINDRLHMTANNAREIFSQHIEDIINAQKNNAPSPLHVMSIERPSGKAAYELLLKPIPIDSAVESERTPQIMVFLSDPECKHGIDVNMLMKLYGLTRAESELAKSLAAGFSLDQSCSSLGIARNTARAQLRAIFAKTGATQQSMLVSLILKSIATLTEN